MADAVRFEGVHCAMGITRPAPGVVLLTISGADVGELGEAPFLELERDLVGPLDFFIDARDTRGASTEVSFGWASWLRRHRDVLGRVTMLPGSSFVRITADFVRRFADLDDIMRITTDPAAFDQALGASVVNAARRPSGGGSTSR